MKPNFPGLKEKMFKCLFLMLLNIQIYKKISDSIFFPKAGCIKIGDKIFSLFFLVVLKMVYSLVFPDE
jgi:hypothetical protein